MRFRWSRDAGRDRDAIFSFMAERNFTAAATNDARIPAIEVQLSRFPESGRVGRLTETREWVVTGTPFIAVYRIEKDTLTVLRITHGAMQWPEDDD